MEKDYLQKSLYEVLYNNVLLPRTHEIDSEDEGDAFNGTTGSLVQLHRENLISYEQFLRLKETQIAEIIKKSKNLPISKERLAIFRGQHCY